MGNLLKKKNKTREKATTHCEIGKRDTTYKETLVTVLEHWVNYYFPEVNDEDSWLKCESEDKNTNKLNSYLFFKCEKISFPYNVTIYFYG